jgi:hypothetical protein
MKTVIQHLIHSFENDRMQSTYSKEQILNLLNFMLEQEKQQIIEAHGNKLRKSRGTSNCDYWVSGEQYYNETFDAEKDTNRIVIYKTNKS